MDPDTGSRPHQRLTSGQDTWSARCGENRTPGAGGARGKRTGGNTSTAPAGYLTPGVAGEGGSSLDNVGTGRYCQTGRVRLARSEGVTRVNQWLKPRNGASGSNLADMGRDAVRDLILGGGSTPEPVLADGEEAALKACGVGAAMLPGYSWTPTWPNDAQ